MGVNLKVILNKVQRACGHGKNVWKCFWSGWSLGNPDLGHLKVTCLVGVVSTFHRKWFHYLTVLSFAFYRVTERTAQFYNVLWFCGRRCRSLCYSSFKQIPRRQIQLGFSSRGIKSIVSEWRCIVFPVRKRQVYLSWCLPYLLESLGLNLLPLCSHLFQIGIWTHTLFVVPSKDCYLKRSLKISDISGSYRFAALSI